MIQMFLQALNCKYKNPNIWNILKQKHSFLARVSLRDSKIFSLFSFVCHLFNLSNFMHFCQYSLLNQINLALIHGNFQSYFRYKMDCQGKKKNFDLVCNMNANVLKFLFFSHETFCFPDLKSNSRAKLTFWYEY